jgi:hypothetical protein
MGESESERENRIEEFTIQDVMPTIIESSQTLIRLSKNCLQGNRGKESKDVRWGDITS